MEKDEKDGCTMREAFYFYGHMHKRFLWLHVVSVCLLLLTSVFWFILPIYIVNYGNYEPNWLMNMLSILFLCTIPSTVVTIHCWIISFNAAKAWCARGHHEGLWRWLIRFQAMAFFVVTSFMSMIYCLFLIIDTLR